MVPILEPVFLHPLREGFKKPRHGNYRFWAKDDVFGEKNPFSETDHPWRGGGTPFSFNFFR